jgi:hypothetical protein
MTRTDNFKKWFSNSKTIHTDSGTVTVFYHKSRSQKVFDEFKHSGEGVVKNPYNKDHGFYFVDSSQKHHISYIGDGIEIFVYLKMENPFLIYDYNFGNIIDQDGKKYDALIMSKEFTESILERGFDSIMILSEVGCNQYVVFNPNQIKSIDNNGEFSLVTNNIFK